MTTPHTSTQDDGQTLHSDLEDRITKPADADLERFGLTRAQYRAAVLLIASCIEQDGAAEPATAVPQPAQETPEELAYTAELLQELAGVCKVLATCVTQERPVRPGLPHVDELWLTTRTLLEGLDHDDEGNGRRAFIDWSAHVIGQLKRVRADMIATSA